MYQIPTFAEYISERLFKSSIDRVKSGEKRTEDKSPLDVICDDIAHIVSEKKNVEYNKDICTWKIKSENDSFSKEYEIKISVYNIKFTVDILNRDIDDLYKVAENICDSIYGAFVMYERETNTCKLMKHVLILLIRKYEFVKYKYYKNFDKLKV